MATIDELARIAGNTFPANTPDAIGAGAIRKAAQDDAEPPRLSAPSPIAQVGTATGPLARAANLAGPISGILGAGMGRSYAEQGQQPTISGVGKTGIIPSATAPQTGGASGDWESVQSQTTPQQLQESQSSPTRDAEMRRISTQSAPVSAVTTARTANGPLNVPMADAAGQAGAPLNAPSEIAYQKAGVSGLKNLAVGEMPTFVMGDGREVAKDAMTPEDQAALARWNDQQTKDYLAQGGGQEGGPQVIYTGKGPLVNGTPTPSGLLAPGSETQLDNYLAAAQQGAVNAVNPQDAGLSKVALENKGKLDVANANASHARVPPGYRPAENGNLEAIPGGPADLKLQGAFNADTATLTNSSAAMDRLALAANEAMKHPGLAGTAGLRGMIPNIPGTDAANAAALLNTLKSQVAFGVLQDMRNNSKTGGALGSVSDAEGKRLEANLAALEKSQSVEQLQSSLQKIIDYTGGAKERLLGAYNLKHGNAGDSVPRSASDGQSQPSKPAAPPQAAAAHLKAHPELRTQFEAKYGKGSAASVLGQ